MSSTTKRTVSNKKIEPVLEETSLTEEPVIASEIPKLRLLVTEDYINYAIGDGIKWMRNTEHDVDFKLFQRLMADNPDIFVRVA